VIRPEPEPAEGGGLILFAGGDALNPPDRSNRLLAMLPQADLELLRPALEAVPLVARDVLDPPGTPISHLYFVNRGLISIVGAVAPDRRIEVGMVGYEGMTGLDAVLGDEASPNETLVQSPGTALRISTADLRRVMKASPALTALLLHYVRVFLVQTSQTALANGRGRIDERLARWLLMWDDRVSDADATITHDFLAVLLGVQRPGVTVALHVLEGKRLIRSTRSHVEVLDRPGLQRAANGYYGVSEAEYERSIRPPAGHLTRNNHGAASRAAVGGLSES
jgi:CRP-like cAMP-binding protein